ncbi:amino acid adenylation domain-containing protein [Polymorphospora sp. NPDC051019]|uniref:non-ribosomal peptide synthetase n=1 Tax=Polymorphospora sp. NPDC051019 TaxID=3155725 RepID=UPI00342488C7
MTAGVRDPGEIKRALLEMKIRQRLAEKAQRQRIVPVPREEKMAVSEQQRYLWFVQQLTPKSPAYNQPFALRLRGALDLAALGEALRGLVVRHEGLRTRFGNDHGVPYQVIDPAPDDWPLTVVDAGDRSVHEWVQEQARVPFDLETGPMFRTPLLRVAPDDHVLLLLMHHIVIDGWSVGLITTELADRYDAAVTGRTLDLPELAIQPADHAAWQRRWLAEEVGEKQLAYWREQLEGAEDLDFPLDRPPPATPTGAGADFNTTLPSDVAKATRAFARDHGVGLLAVLYAAYLAVLRRYSGQDDIAIGGVLHGHTRSEIEPLVGYFANMVVLRSAVGDNPTFGDLVRRCNETVLDSISNQDVPFGAVVDTLKPERVAGRNPLFQVCIALTGATMATQFRLGDLAVERVPVHVGTSRFDLTFMLFDGADGELRLWVEHSTETIDAERAHRLVDHFTTVLAEALADPTVRVDDLTLLPRAELSSVLADWNPEPVERSAALLHDLVTERVTAQPDHTAMRFEGTELTYRDLDHRANQLAHQLAHTGARPGTVTALLLDRGLHLPVAELGILKTGSAWLALDPQYPDDRLAYQLTDAAVTTVVTTTDLAHRLPHHIHTITLDTDTLDTQPTTSPTVDIHPEDTAYVIYTSGSTGRPKGVMVPHRAIANFCRNMRELFKLGPGDRVLQFSNPSFDVSVSDFFTTFTTGATLVGAPRATLLDPDRLQELMRDERITFIDIPPAVLRLLDPEPLVDLRALFIGMEPFPAALVNRWRRPGREFHNGYGPTEVTVTCTDYLCPSDNLDAAPPIGRAMDNQRAYVLDRNLRPAPIGIPGELYMAGDGLAHGYLGRTDLTAEKFLPDPFTTQPGQRMYATGDVVRWRTDGNIEFVGRVDRQVKIRGLRIELGEIEHVLADHPGVRQGVVAVRDPGTPDAYLAGYVVPETGQDVDLDEVRRFLSDRLPLHMVPSALLTLTELPLSPTGKVDHRRLPDPTPDRTGFAEPATDTQRRLADVWRTLLGVERIGAVDSFFGLGGNSLQATQLISRIRDRFEVTLEARQIFTHPTLEQLAAQIDEAAQPRLDAAELDALEAEIAGLSEEEIDKLLGEAG